MSDCRNVEVLAAGDRIGDGSVGLAGLVFLMHGWLPFVARPSRPARVTWRRVHDQVQGGSAAGDAFIDDSLLAVGEVCFDEGLPNVLICRPDAGRVEAGFVDRALGP